MESPELFDRRETCLQWNHLTFHVINWLPRISPDEKARRQAVAEHCLKAMFEKLYPKG